MVIILNIVINILICFMLFSLCSATINIDLDRYRVVSLSILDGVIISGLGVVMLPVIGLVCIYFVLFSVSSVVLFYPINLQKSIILELVFIAYILLGWGLSHLLQLLYFNIFALTIKSYYIFNFLRGLVVGIVSFFAYCLFKVLYKRKEILDYVYDIEISLKGYRLRLKMFLDSGNLLYDNNGTPVIVVAGNVLRNRYDMDIVADSTLEYSTIGGEVLVMSILNPDYVMLIKNEGTTMLKAVIGVANNDFKIYDGLLHSSLIGG